MFLALTVVAAACLSVQEWLYRKQDDTATALLMALPLIVLAQACLHYVFNKAPNVMAAWVTLSLVMTAFRVANSAFILQEGLDYVRVGLAAALMLAGGFVLKQA